MQHQNHFAIGLLIWLVSGGFVGYLVHVQNESRVDWPVGFSSKEDFVPVHLHPTHADITRDWTRWGGGRRPLDFLPALPLDQKKGLIEKVIPPCFPPQRTAEVSDCQSRRMN